MQEKPTEYGFQVKPSSKERERSRLGKGRNTSRPCGGLMFEHNSSNKEWIQTKEIRRRDDAKETQPRWLSATRVSASGQGSPEQNKSRVTQHRGAMFTWNGGRTNDLVRLIARS